MTMLRRGLSALAIVLCTLLAPAAHATAANTVVAFVKNAFDEEGYLRSSAGSPTAVGPRREVAPIFPRTYGAEVQVRF